MSMTVTCGEGASEKNKFILRFKVLLRQIITSINYRIPSKYIKRYIKTFRVVM